MIFLMGSIKWYFGDELDLELGLCENNKEVFNEQKQSCIYYLQNIINYFIKFT